MKKIVIVFFVVVTVCGTSMAASKGFKKADSDKDGKISQDEFLAATRNHKTKLYMKNEGLTQEAAETKASANLKKATKGFKKRDVDQDGFLNEEEFDKK